MNIKIGRTDIRNGHMCLMDGVVRDKHTNPEVVVMGSNVGGHKAHIFCAKKCVACDCLVGSLLVLKVVFFARAWLSSGVHLVLEKLLLFQLVFGNRLITVASVMPVQKSA